MQNKVKKSCILFCDCGKLSSRDGKWHTPSLSLEQFIAFCLRQRISIAEFRKITCPACVTLGAEAA